MGGQSPFYIVSRVYLVLVFFKICFITRQSSLISLLMFPCLEKGVFLLTLNVVDIQDLIYFLLLAPVVY